MEISKMKIYVISRHARYGEEENVYNGQKCYADIEKARKVMMDEFMSTCAEWEENTGYRDVKREAVDGYCSIWDETPGGKYDYEEWSLDALELEE